jgi:hypothetical protein
MAQGPLTEYGEARAGDARRELKARLSAVRKLSKGPLEKAAKSLAKSEVSRKELMARSQAGSRAGPAESDQPAVVALAKAIRESGLGGAGMRKQLLSSIGVVEEELIPVGMLAGERGMHTVAEIALGGAGPEGDGSK